jgi:hypothetical protein
MSKKTDAVEVWKPKEFDGNDLLPIDDAVAIAEIEGVPELVGREHVNPKDLILPSLALLHGTSDAVQDKLEGAEAGLFFHTGTEEVFPEGPLRLIFVHHHMGNAMFPKEGERWAGLETCISRDQVEGSKYGLCQECRKCLDWDNEQNLPPLGAETHHFVVLTDRGPLTMRFSRTSFKAANKFISGWMMSRKNLWAHPVVVRVATGDKTLPTGKVKKYHHMQLAWQTTEKVPAELQRTAFALYKEVESKHESGNLKSNDEGTSDESDEFFDSQPD